MMMNDEVMQDCIEACWECRHECQTALYTYCIEEGGSHVKPDHVRLMTDCIQICQISADFMTRQSVMHHATCRACMEICEACAKSCKTIGMDDCAATCRTCAAACRQMISGGQQRMMA